MIRALTTRSRTGKDLLTLGALLLLCAFSLLSVRPAHAARQDLTLYNRTGMTIEELHVSRHSSTLWGRDLLGSGVLRNGGSTDITFAYGEDEDEWDIKVKGANGESYTLYDLNLSSFSHLSLRMDGDGTMVYSTW